MPASAFEENPVSPSSTIASAERLFFPSLSLFRRIIGFGGIRAHCFDCLLEERRRCDEEPDDGKAKEDEPGPDAAFDDDKAASAAAAESAAVPSGKGNKELTALRDGRGLLAEGRRAPVVETKNGRGRTPPAALDHRGAAPIAQPHRPLASLLSNHLGLEDRALAEFVISLAEKKLRGTIKKSSHPLLDVPDAPTPSQLAGEGGAVGVDAAKRFQAKLATNGAESGLGVCSRMPETVLGAARYVKEVHEKWRKKRRKKRLKAAAASEQAEAEEGEQPAPERGEEGEEEEAERRRC